VGGGEMGRKRGVGRKEGVEERGMLLRFYYEFLGVGGKNKKRGLLSFMCR